MKKLLALVSLFSIASCSKHEPVPLRADAKARAHATMLHIRDLMLDGKMTEVVAQIEVPPEAGDPRLRGGEVAAEE